MYFGFWILGGELEQTHFEETGFLTQAFSNVLGQFKEKSQERDNWLNESNNDYTPTMYTLLGKVSKDKENLALLFLETENINYAVNRYQDDFSKGFKKIKTLTAQLQGMIFEIMSHDSDYLHAKITEDVINSCIVKYDKKDIVTNWTDKHFLHHGIDMRSVSKPKMMSLFRKIRKLSPDDRLSAQERIDVILELTGLHFHYEHEHKELFGLIEKWNKTHKKNSIDLDKMKAACADIAKKHNAKEAADAKEYRDDKFCHLISDWDFDR